MTVHYDSNKILYTGNASANDFAIPFPFEAASQIEVILRDETDPADITETALVEGDTTSGYDLTGVDILAGIPGTGIHTYFVPSATQKILIRRTLELEQDIDLPPSGPFLTTEVERGLDQSVMRDQQLQEQLDRAVLMSPTSTTTPPTFPDPADGALIRFKEDGSGKLETVMPGDLGITGSGGGVGGTVGAPTDGTFGVTEPIAGVAEDDTIADAFDKVESVLAKLAPPKPQNLSAVTPTLNGAYTALEASTGTSRTTVTDSTQPTVVAAQFYDGDAGTLSGEVDGSVVGTITLSTASDVGSNGDLNITLDEDPYAGQAGKENFWKRLTANITPLSALSVANHTFQFKHTTSGNSAILTAYIDNPATPSISNASASSSGSSSTVSGVPGLAQGQAIAVSFDVSNAVSRFYNPSQIGRVTSGQTATLNLSPGTPPASGVTVSLSGNATVSASAYTESWTGTATGYNSKGGTGAGTITPATPIRMDTVSVNSTYNETTRSKSGAGQFPTKGSGATQFGDAFDSSALLTAANNEELQLLNGEYQYPPATNYSTKYPAGPNYSAIAGGSFSTYRWATFSKGSISSAVNVTINLIGSTGISSVLQSGMILQVMVEGQTGWLDANAAYPGVGSPSSDGDPACVVGSSTATSRVVTFGSTPRSGTVWVRIGFPSGSTKKIQGITRT